MIEDEVVRIRITHPFQEIARVATIDVPFTRKELLDPDKAGDRDRLIKAVITETELMFKDFDSSMRFVDPLMRLAPAATPPPMQTAAQTQPLPNRAPSAIQPQGPPQTQPTVNPVAPVCDICAQTKYWKVAGVNRNTGAPYDGFWACGNYKNHPPKQPQQPQQPGPQGQPPF